MSKQFTLRKSERLSRRKSIELLFTSSDSFLVYPFRVAYSLVDKGEDSVCILVSVSKRRFKHAVDRNAVKRRIKEAYRLNKFLLSDVMNEKENSLHIAFIYIGKEIMPFAQLQPKMIKTLDALKEKLL